MTDRRPAAVQSPSEAETHRWAWLLLLVVLLLVGTVRWHRLEVPMERDEGEYAYAGQLILQGMPPYAGAYNMKLPGIYVFYALIMAVFGQTIWGVHLGLLLVNLASIVLVFMIGLRLIDGLAAVGAAAVFATLSVHPSVSGLFANSEHFVILPMLGGLLTLLAATHHGRARSFIGAGFLMGLAFIIKQHGIAFVAMGGIAIAAAELQARPFSWRRLVMRGSWYGIGAALPYVMICSWMLLAGVFEQFWFWTFTYAARYVSQIGWDSGMTLLSLQVMAMGGALVGLWLLAAAGLTAVAWDRVARSQWILLVAFTLGSIAAVFPGLLFRNHYFLFVLPAAGLLAGVALSAGARLLNRVVAPATSLAIVGVIFAAAIGWAVAGQWGVLVSLSDAGVTRAIYGLNPFPESLEIAQYLRRSSTPTDQIAVIGSEPQLYFYSGRRAATSHIYTYALMEEHPFALQMQQQMIQQIEQNQPKFIVFVSVPTSWLVRPSSPQEIFDWTDQYVSTHYVQTGMIELRPGKTTFRWDKQAAGRPAPNDAPWIGVYRRKAG